jgi:hypothetical protein
MFSEAHGKTDVDDLQVLEMGSVFRLVIWSGPFCDNNDLP